MFVLACFRPRHGGRLVEGASVFPACQNLRLAAREPGYGGVMTTWHMSAAAELAEIVARGCLDMPTRGGCPGIQTLPRCLDLTTQGDDTPSRGPFRIYNPASLGVAIRRYRTEAGLTQAQLATMAGLQRSYLSELENGKETEQVKRLLRVLRQVGVRMTLDKGDW